MVRDMAPLGRSSRSWAGGSVAMAAAGRHGDGDGNERSAVWIGGVGLVTLLAG